VHQADVFWMAWIRYLLGLGVVVVPAWSGVWSLHVQNRSAFAWRGVLGCLSLFGLLLVIDKVGLGRGTVLINLSAVFATLAAIPLLHERPRPVVSVAVVCATVGVMLCSQTGWPSGWEWCALAGACFSGLTLPFIRILRRTDSNVVSLYAQCLFGALLLLPFLSMERFPGAASTIALIVAMAACDILGQFCLSPGLKSVPVARSTVILMLTPITSLLAGVFLFSEILTGRQWLGCATVLLSSILVIMARKECREFVSPAPSVPQGSHDNGVSASWPLLENTRRTD
jgi:drug/metabolite transporter (DMT)-like permease